VSRAAKAPPKQHLVYEGPVGACPCCNTPTEVRLASTHGESPVEAWIVPKDVLGYLYREVADRIKEKGGLLYVTDPSTYDASVRSKLFFVDGVDGIAGPFGQTGLKVFLGASLDASKPENVLVYVVSTTHRSLSIIRKSPYASPAEDAADLDDSSDLF
jgi:hypothetical protein